MSQDKDKDSTTNIVKLIVPPEVKTNDNQDQEIIHSTLDPMVGVQGVHDIHASLIEDFGFTGCLTILIDKDKVPAIILDGDEHPYTMMGVLDYTKNILMLTAMTQGEDEDDPDE